MQFRTKDLVLNISTTLSSMISHTRLFVTGQLWNPCQMLNGTLGFRRTPVENHCIKELKYMCHCALLTRNNNKQERWTWNLKFCHYRVWHY